MRALMEVERIEIGELAECVFILKPSATRTIKNLRNARDRRAAGRSSTDQRRAFIALTPRGRKLFESSRRIPKWNMRASPSSSAPRQCRSSMSCCGRVTDTLNGLEAEALAGGDSFLRHGHHCLNPNRSVAAELARRRIHLLDEPEQAEVEIVDLVFRVGEVLHPQRALPPLVGRGQRDGRVADGIAAAGTKRPNWCPRGSACSRICRRPGRPASPKRNGTVYRPSALRLTCGACGSSAFRGAGTREDGGNELDVRIEERRAEREIEVAQRPREELDLAALHRRVGIRHLRLRVGEREGLVVVIIVIESGQVQPRVRARCVDFMPTS